MYRCPHCGRDNRTGAAFCDGCGGVLSGAPAAASVFVDRHAELLLLHDVLVQAREAQGRILLVGGEPGIGKSRFAQESALRAAELGYLVLWGRCLEDPGAPPYWPWLQLLRGWLETAGADRLIGEAGRDSALLTELLPELAECLPPDARTPPSSVPTYARFRLFEAMVRIWKQAAGQRPLLLVIDNLHAADPVSLRFLEFLAPVVTDSALILLATYRDAISQPPNPLSNTLSELVGLPHCRRMKLHGLTRSGSDRLLHGVCGAHPPSAELAAAIHAQSEGNPLFIRELAQSLIHQGTLGSGTAGSLGHLPVPIPDGIREVLRQRFRPLSGRCAAVLSTAAVIGRSFELELLVGLDADTTVAGALEALDEALAAGLIEERGEPGRYQFSHALVRETLYDELPATRRMQLHLGIGRRLADADRGEDMARLRRLAHHFSQAAPLGVAADAVAYATRAGARADRLLAYEEAVRLYGLAVELQSRYGEGDGESEQRCGLLLALGTAKYRAGDYVQAMGTFREAAENAGRRGDAGDLARAALGFEEAGFRPGLPGTTASHLLRRAVAAIGDDDSQIRARLLSALTRALIFTGDLEEALRVQDDAVKLARGLDDPGILARALCAGLSARWRPDRLHHRLEAAREAVGLAKAAGDWELLLNSLSWQLFDLLEAADMEGARTVLERHDRLAEELRQPFYRYIAVSFRSVLALLEGHFERSEALAREALALGQRQGLDAAGVFSLQMFSIERARGGLAAVAPVLECFLSQVHGSAVWRPGLALLYAELGRLDDARSELERLAADDFAQVPRDALWVACLAYLSEVCAALGDGDRAAVLYRELEPYAGHNVVAGTTVACYGAADRYLGLLAATVGDAPAADRHFRAGLDLDRRTGARPYLAQGQYDYAAFRLRRDAAGDRDAARALLRDARDTARALGMKALRERIDRLCSEVRLSIAQESEVAGLSRREIEVLRLLAAGRSNREIAERLFVSPHTVANHVRNILGKTGTANRTEAAAFARERHLLAG